MATGGVGNLALGGDARRPSAYENEKSGYVGSEGISANNAARFRALRDPSVTFDEYYHYAQLARAEEDETAASEPPAGLLQVLFPPKNNQSIATSKNNGANYGDNGISDTDKQTSAPPKGYVDITDEEWLNAGRAIRTASGAACFYLITTDILGPYGLAYSFGTVGWAPGVVLFTIFAILAGYSGWLIHQMFMGTDSYQYPTRAYGDVAYRIYGQAARIPVNILQGLQLILTVSLITISNGQALSIITKFKLCYVVCIVILVVVGMVLGQIRTLQKFGWLANAAVFMNVFIMILTMAVAATSDPNFPAAGILSAGASLGGTVPGESPLGTQVAQQKDGSYAPVAHYTNIPPNPLGFIGAVNGIMNTVFAYGGANVFNEFMAEMKRPRDFLKAMWSAQFFIWFVYMFYGLFMYGYQGQYSVNPSPQTVSPYWALVIANVFYILSATIAAILYGNIGLKVIYNNIFVEIFKAPTLTTHAGKLAWIFLIPLYWAIAFVIGGSIPNFPALVGLVAALCIVQFTYSLPPLFHIGYTIQKNAIQAGEGIDPATGQLVRHDQGFRRWRRGILAGSALDKAIMAWNVIYCLASFAMAGLGTYSAIELIKLTFDLSSKITTYSCASPLNFQI